MPARRSRAVRDEYDARIKDLAEELGVDLGSITGTGAQGRITAEDVLNVGLPVEDIKRASVDASAGVPDAEPVGASAAPTGGAQEGGAVSEQNDKASVIASPRAREVAKELGVDIEKVAGTGARGRVTPADVRAFARDLREQQASSEDIAGEPSQPATAFPPNSGRWTAELDGYAKRVERARAYALAKVIRDYSARVEGVREGRLAPSAAIAPAGIEPEMVGKTLAAGSARQFLELIVEVSRNILIFIPVLVTWIKIQGSGVNDLGDMRGTALAVVILIIALISVHVVLGLLRRHTAARADRISRDFAAVLTNASMEASAQQAETTEAAIAAFAQAGRELTASLQGAGDSLAGTRDVMTRMADAVAKQGEQVEGLMELLAPISRIGDQIGGAQRELSAAAVTMNSTARSLAGIEKNIAPTAEKLGGTVQELGELARQLDVTGKQLERMTEVFAERFGPMDQSAAHFGESIQQLNLVANRVAEALDALQQARDGARGRSHG